MLGSEGLDLRTHPIDMITHESILLPTGSTDAPGLSAEGITEHVLLILAEVTAQVVWVLWMIFIIVLQFFFLIKVNICQSS